MGLSFSSTAVADSPRETLFSVDGKDYSIPSTLPASRGLEYLRRSVEVSPDAALVYALRTALGADGFAALESATDISSEDLQTVMNACTRLLVGALNGAPKATPPTAPATPSTPSA